MKRWYKTRVPTTGPVQIRMLFVLMNEQRIGITDLAQRAGLHGNTIRKWRTRYMPSVDALEACLNVLGYTLKVEKKNDPSRIGLPDKDWSVLRDKAGS